MWVESFRVHTGSRRIQVESWLNPRVNKAYGYHMCIKLCVCMHLCVVFFFLQACFVFCRALQGLQEHEVRWDPLVPLYVTINSAICYYIRHCVLFLGGHRTSGACWKPWAIRSNCKCSNTCIQYRNSRNFHCHVIFVA